MKQKKVCPTYAEILTSTFAWRGCLSTKASAVWHRCEGIWRGSLFRRGMKGFLDVRGSPKRMRRKGVHPSETNAISREQLREKVGWGWGWRGWGRRALDGKKREGLSGLIASVWSVVLLVACCCPAGWQWCQLEYSPTKIPRSFNKGHLYAGKASRPHVCHTKQNVLSAREQKTSGSVFGKTQWKPPQTYA